MYCTNHLLVYKYIKFHFILLIPYVPGKKLLRGEINLKNLICS